MSWSVDLVWSDTFLVYGWDTVRILVPVKI